MRFSRTLAVAAAIFGLASNFAFAASISATMSAEIRVEINSDPKPVKSSADYSGLVVDCRGLGLQTAASPVIKTESGKIIYGDKDLDFDKINDIGMAAYATTMQESVNRVGSRPLVVRAVGVDRLKSNPILKNNDAEKVVLANEVSEFFKDLKVVFLTD